MQQVLDCDDMCLMSSLTEQSILANLVNRYHKDKIYTSIGPTLISLNPYKEIPELYQQAIVEKIKETVITGHTVKEPHIFSIAGRTFQGMINQVQKQAIIISGESGAGKTESAKYCMQMLTNLSQNQERQHPLEEKILACNPLLEAFGNSKTVRNQNSSRFGKYVQIFFGPDQTIRGANIKSYLLQKSRVTNVAKSQRSFHIFYALCKGGLRGANNAQSYTFLSQSECFQAQGIDDIVKLNEIKQAMNELNFSQDEQDRIWTLLVTILDLGNLTFDDTNRQNNENLPCVISDLCKIDQLSSVLGYPSADFQKMLVYSKIEIPRQQCIFKTMDKMDCYANRNTLCKAIYNSIFQFILSKIQRQLNPPIEAEDLLRSLRMSMKLTGSAPPPSRFEINILDIFGFQNFKQNSLEQLCINYTNQKLLDLYNRCVFENELSILREDGLENQIDSIAPPSNFASVSLLDAIFRTIKDNTRVKHAKDQDIVRQLKENRGKNQHFKTLDFDKFNEKLFVIQHSPCKVTYNCMGFKLKNQDKLTTEIESITSNLFKRQGENHSAKTLLQKFTTEINNLNTELQTATNHYVRCIKPNEEKTHTVINEFVLKQIRYMGVFETVQIRKRVFPCRRTYEEMGHLFGPLFKETKGKPLRAVASLIMNEIKASPTEFLMGTRRIYMSVDLEQKLNQKFIEYQKKRVGSIKKIQKYFKRKRSWQIFRECVLLVIDRILILKKWGSRARKVVFCCFQEIAQKANSKKLEQQKEQLQKSMNSLSQSGPKPKEEKKLEPQTASQEQLQLPSEVSPLKQMSQLLKKRSTEAKETDYEIVLHLQMIKQQLESKQNKLRQQKIVELQLVSNQLELQNDLRSARSKLTDSQRQIFSLNQNLGNQKGQNERLKGQVESLRQKNQILNQKIHEKQSLCVDLEQKLNSKALQKQKIDENLKQDIESKLQQIKALSDFNLVLKSELQTLQLQLSTLKTSSEQLIKQKSQYSSKLSEYQSQHIKESNRIRQLEDMVITMENILASTKVQNIDYKKSLDEVNKKYYKKCLSYEQLHGLLQEERKKGREEPMERGKSYNNKDIIEKLQYNLNELNDDRENLLRQNSELERQLDQYEKLMTGVRESFGGNRGGKDYKSAIHPNNEHLTTQQLYSQILSFKKGRSKQQLLKVRQKLCFLLP